MNKELLEKVLEELRKEFQKETIEASLTINPNNFRQEIVVHVGSKVFSSNYSWEDVADMNALEKDAKKILKEDLANSIRAVIETRSLER